jgi:hypothetical protein
METSSAPAGTVEIGTVEIVVPVYNEERDLAPSVRRLRAYLDDGFPFRAVITIADNASTDGTWAIAESLATADGAVRAVHLDQKGRGRALKRVWLASRAEVVAYMDVDLSTGLEALLPLVAPLLSHHSDVAIGSRLATGARVVRGTRREFISRTYNHILHAALRNQVTDAQCGFKAMRADVARRLLPLVEDSEWFFDTELLTLAERNGLRIHEVPVDWVDDPDSRVDVVATSIADLKGIWRLKREFAAGRGRLPEEAQPVRSRPAHRATILRADAGSGPSRGVAGRVFAMMAWAVWFIATYPLLGPAGAEAAGLLAAGILALIACLVAAIGDVGGRDDHQGTQPLRSAGRTLLLGGAATGAGLIAAGLLTSAPGLLAAAGLGVWVAGVALFDRLRRSGHGPAGSSEPTRSLPPAARSHPVVHPIRHIEGA